MDENYVQMEKLLQKIDVMQIDITELKIAMEHLSTIQAETEKRNKLLIAITVGVGGFLGWMVKVAALFFGSK